MSDINNSQQFVGGRKEIGNEPFCFECHPGLECFTKCCQNADMYLYPYDIVRMKNRLGISSGRFLEEHTTTAYRDNPHFPSLMLKMSDDEEKSCPFLSPEGCTIYEDRPYSCRAYPMERAVGRDGETSGRIIRYFIAVHPYCLGHQEAKKWTSLEWILNQQIKQYDDMNDLWVDVDTLFRNNPWGPQGVNNPALKMAFMACFDMDRFKSFITESTFLSRFDVDSERLKHIQNSNTERMKFGFDWVKYFLTGEGPLILK